MLWQGGFSVVDFPGNLGDLFGHVDDSLVGMTVLKAAKILRGQAHGHILAPNKTIASGIPVDLFETPGYANRGIGTSSAQGAYKTGLPFGRSSRGHEIKTRTIDAELYSIGMTPRRQTRVAFWLKNTSILIGGGDGGDSTTCKFRNVYFPFDPQFSDEHLLPVEEWRRIPHVIPTRRKSKTNTSPPLPIVPASNTN